MNKHLSVNESRCHEVGVISSSKGLPVHAIGWGTAYLYIFVRLIVFISISAENLSLIFNILKYQRV